MEIWTCKKAALRMTNNENIRIMKLEKLKTLMKNDHLTLRESEKKHVHVTFLN